MKKHYIIRTERDVNSIKVIITTKKDLSIDGATEFVTWTFVRECSDSYDLSYSYIEKLVTGYIELIEKYDL